VDSDIDLLMNVSSGFSRLVFFGLDLALLIVAVTAVRRYRRRLMGWFLAPAIVGLVMDVVHPVSSWAVSGAGAMDYPDTLYVNMIIGVVSTIISAASYTILLIGIVKLSRPAPQLSNTVENSL